MLAGVTEHILALGVYWKLVNFHPLTEVVYNWLDAYLPGYWLSRSKAFLTLITATRPILTRIDVPMARSW